MRHTRSCAWEWSRVLRRTGVHCTCGPLSPCSGCDCVKSLRSSYIGQYPQSHRTFSISVTAHSQSLSPPVANLCHRIFSISVSALSQSRSPHILNLCHRKLPISVTAHFQSLSPHIVNLCHRTLLISKEGQRTFKQNHHYW